MKNLLRSLNFCSGLLNLMFVFFKVIELQLDYFIILNSCAALFSFYIFFEDLHNEN